ncbi:hypothetical protein AOXY_G26805, partial [Acipenser oxyrinchus oxyrinchus]
FLSESPLTDWLPTSFRVISITNTHVSRFVSTRDELNNVLECHTRATLTSFTKKEKGMQRLVWQMEDFSDNVPLAVKNRVIHCCQYGKAHKRDSSGPGVRITELDYTFCDHS